MDFSLDEPQRAVADLAADVLGRDGDGPDDVWPAMAKAGLLCLALPADLGGDGLDVLAVSLVLAEVGRHASEVPALATLALGVLPVVHVGTSAQRQNLLPPVAEGSRILTAATSEPGDPLPVTPRTTARLDGDTFLVNGTKIGVPHAADAYRVLLPVSLADGGAGVLLLDPHTDGVRLDQAASDCRLRMTNVRVPVGDLLGDSTDGSAVAELNALAVAGACALGDGLLAGALALTTGHIRTREQFGRPLAAFQAVAQQIADVYIAGRTLHLAARSACWRLDAGRPAAVELDVAGYWLAAELLPAMHICHHLHGGLGLDVTYPMHRYYAQAQDLTRFVGGVEARLGRLGASACSSN
ncbi:MAG TPA: acyl-CoA dehydrogenase family protein [Pseudonocardiaceae bacterium]|nr:acyl-CoA dehydrogenase family protein [Pseudonocardiaceae bacterium]